MRRNLLLGITCVLVTTVAIDAQEPKRLTPDVPVEAALSPGDSHAFVITSQARQAFQVSAEQRAMDIVVTVSDPGGKQIVQVDRASEDEGRGGTEIAMVRALDAGEYRVTITPFVRPDAKPGRYVVKLSGMRPMTEAEATNARGDREVAEIEDRWEKAVEQLDVPTLTAILGPDAFKLGPHTHDLATREDMIKAWEERARDRRARGATVKHSLSEHVIRASGRVAVSTGRFLINSKPKDQDMSRTTGQFIHVWEKGDDGWKLLADYTFPFGRIPAEKSAPVAVSEDVLRAYVGQYRQQHSSVTLDVRLENGGLVLGWSAPGQPPATMPLAAANDYTFTAGDFLESTFVRGADGSVREIVLLGEGPATRAMRVK